MLQDRQYVLLEGEQAIRIDGFNYAITESGRIWKFWNKEVGKENEPLVYSKNGRSGSIKPLWIEPIIPTHGYVNVRLSGETRLRTDLKTWHTGAKKFTRTVKTALIHTLVAEYFVPNPSGYGFVEHIDKIKTNNHYTNLRWADKDPMDFAFYMQKNKGALLDFD